MKTFKNLTKRQKNIFTISGLIVLVVIASVIIIMPKGEEEQELGKIDNLEDVTEVEDNAESISSQDSLGNEYILKKFPALGITMNVPKDWEVEADPMKGVIYFKNTNEQNKYSDIEFCLKYTAIEGFGGSHLQSKFNNFLGMSYEYKNSEVIDKYVGEVSEIRDEEHEYNVAADPMIGYFEYEGEPPREEFEQYMPGFAKEKKLIGYYENSPFTFGNIEDGATYSTVYYMFSKNTKNLKMGVAFVTTGDKSHELEIEEISKKIAFSMKITNNDKATLEEVTTLSLNDKKLDDVSIKIPPEGLITKDPNEWSYGATTNIMTVSKEEINTENFLEIENDLIFRNIYAGVIGKTYEDVSNTFENQIYPMTVKKPSSVVIGGHNAKLYSYEFYANSTNSKINYLNNVKIGNVPAQSLVIDMGNDVVIITVTGLPQSKMVVEKYMNFIINSVQ